MLSRLNIRNYAIIDHLEIEFSQGLNIITGETGAGKSIIVGALGLILGERAESNVLLNREKKCIVEGFFSGDMATPSVSAFLKNHELDLLDELVVRREIAPNGKSRAFINDTPVNLSQLHQLSGLIVDLHQQFDTLDVTESGFQREVLDAMASNQGLMKQYHDEFIKMRSAKSRMEELNARREQFRKDADYHQFQFNELDEAGLKENEIEDLEQELKLQSNAEGIKSALVRTYQELDGEEEPLVKRLKSLIHALQPYSEIQAEIPQILERMHSAAIELQDLASESERISDHILSDALEIERIQERLSMAYRLLKKHGVKTTHELISIRQELARKLEDVLHIDDEIEKAEQEYQQYTKQVLALADKISESRRLQVKPLETQVNKMLAQVGMPNARLKVEMQKTDPGADGNDRIEFLFNANLPAGKTDKGALFLPVRKVASGGELSRLMLCIKSLVARSMDLPTLIFDEIDTGISGEAARQVGIIMKELALARQVICITHQPQLAGKADAHYLVYKSVKEAMVTTGVKLLSPDERIVAIAKMLSGEKPTAAAMENAREMVG